jgi:hypothetical protein
VDELGTATENGETNSDTVLMQEKKETYGKINSLSPGD